MRSFAPHIRRAGLIAMASAVAAGCGPASNPSPATGDDLYRYSLAVAEGARRKVRDDWYLPLYYIGKVHQRFGMEDRALELFERALELEPHAARIHADRGYILSNRKDRMSEAIDAYQQALLCDSSLEGVYTRIGLVLTHLGRLDEAAMALLREERRGTADAVTYYNLGQVHRLGGQHDDAVRFYRRSLEESPDMREALYGLARSLKALGRGEEAAAVDARFRELKAEGERKDLETRARETNLDEQRGLAAETWSDVFDLLNRAGRAAEDPARREKLFSDAVAAVHESLRFDAGQPDAYRFLIDHYRRKKDTARALEMAERSVRALPESAVLLYEAASLYLETAPKNEASDAPPPEVDRAIELLERALELRPELAPAHLLLAEAILFRKRLGPLLAPALEHARRALELARAPSPRHYDILAMAHFYNRDVSAAAETLREGIRRFPDHRDLTRRLRRLEDELR